ncbi:hypothetical protein F5Y10DRAFT_272269 [Nemania abortiva]|nr:hypothetical protein F5Y10DRAFT_272269 [Nemania abortiva]
MDQNKNDKRPKVAMPDLSRLIGPPKEKEEDLYVLVDRELPTTRSNELVSSHDCYPPPKDDKDKVGTKDKDGWETLPLHAHFEHNPILASTCNCDDLN